jgi:hypothetical protein
MILVQKDRQTERKKDRQINRQTERKKTDRQTGKKPLNWVSNLQKACENSSLLTNSVAVPSQGNS